MEQIVHTSKLYSSTDDPIKLRCNQLTYPCALSANYPIN